MDRYTLEWFDEYCDELLDKMGSDLFPLPIKYNRFKTLTLEFINYSAKYMEATQKVSDDIKDLIVKGKFPLVQNTIEDVWETAEPSNYYRLISIVPLFEDKHGTEMKVCKKPAIMKEGQRLAVGRDPFKCATDEYPNIYRLSNLFQIDVGPKSTIGYSTAICTYIKKPTFALLSNLEDRIVNLHDSAIEQIVLKTADSLRFSTGDQNSISNYQFNQTYGNGKTDNL